MLGEAFAHGYRMAYASEQARVGHRQWLQFDGLRQIEEALLLASGDSAAAASHLPRSLALNGEVRFPCRYLAHPLSTIESGRATGLKSWIAVQIGCAEESADQTLVPAARL